MLCNMLYTLQYCYVTKVVCNIKCMLYNISQPSRWFDLPAPGRNYEL